MQVTPSRAYHVHLMDGSREVVQKNEIRPHVTYTVNETVEFLHNDIYVNATVTGFHPEDYSFDVTTVDGNQTLQHVHPGLFRRYR